MTGTRAHGLHGRISNTPAEHVCVSEGWENGTYRMTVSGRMIESCMKDENLMLTRTFSSVLGENKLILTDVVENRGMYAEPLMLLYHCNVGYPFLDAGSRIVTASSVTPNDEEAAKNLAACREITDPQPGIEENLFYHDIRPDADGYASVALVNDRLEAGVYLRYPKANMPYLTEWKQLTKQDYVLGLEPGNCMPHGRKRFREEGLCDTIEAGEKKTFTLEIGILADADEIAAFEARVKTL